MSQHLIIFPTISLVALTLGMILWMARLRFVAALSGEVDPRYFKLNRGGELPEQLIKVTHNYDNLLELPVLFYALCCLLLANGQVELAQIIMAWLFVVSRYVHSYIHTTSNRLIPRLKVFALGVALLIAMGLLGLYRLLQLLAETTVVACT